MVPFSTPPLAALKLARAEPLPGGAPEGSSLPNREWLGRPLAISDFISDREFRRRGLYAEVCKPLGVRAVMKVSCQQAGQPARR
jgi:hypothetical protein